MRPKLDGITEKEGRADEAGAGAVALAAAEGADLAAKGLGATAAEEGAPPKTSAALQLEARPVPWRDTSKRRVGGATKRRVAGGTARQGTIANRVLQILALSRLPWHT